MTAAPCLWCLAETKENSAGDIGAVAHDKAFNSLHSLQMIGLFSEKRRELKEMDGGANEENA